MQQLNELLQAAKAASTEYKTAQAQYKLGDKRRTLASRRDNLAWDKLHTAVCQLCPLTMITTENETLKVGTGGLLVDRSMFFYSEQVNATTFLQGHNFNGIDRFEPAQVLPVDKVSES